MNYYNYLIFGLAMFLGPILAPAHANVPITTDSRVKTLLYNENEVFTIHLQYGFLTSIEFSEKEAIKLFEFGEPHSWSPRQVGKRRIFLKALEGAARTNMTVITDQRTYQFELISKFPEEMGDEERAYVIRFLYPGASAGPYTPTLPQLSTQAVPPAGPSGFAAGPTPPLPQPYNFNYSLTGAENIAPVKVFDDGSATYLQFRNQNANVPHIFIMTPDGRKERANFKEQQEYVVIDRIVGRLALQIGDDITYVYNDQLHR